VAVASSSADVARRIDESGGFREEATFFGSGRARLFGVLHRPEDPPVGGVVICPSIYAEFMAGYRMDVAVARALASRGLAVQRFHYRGVGHSDGEASEMTFATMVEDARTAAERLASETGVTRLAFLGTRFGALIAASMAAERRECPLVLVEPVLDAKRFFRDAWRAFLIRSLRAGATDAPPSPGLSVALAQEEAVDILGYAICRSLFESASERTLTGELGPGARRVLVVQLGRTSALRKDTDAAREALDELGCHVDIEAVTEDVMWWFPPSAETTHVKRRGLTDVTSAWLGRELQAAVA
jgi:pimeloyl-ACP methyl ester carboxylesterase